MKFQGKFALPLLATVGLVVLLFRESPNWVTMPQRQSINQASTEHSVPTKYSVPRDKLILGSIDSHDEQSQIHGQSDSLLETFGWIASTKADDPIKKVDVLVNGRAMATVSISFARPDVAAAFDRPDFSMSGWRAFIPLDGITAGEYELGVRGITASGKEGTLVPLKLLVSE